MNRTHVFALVSSILIAAGCGATDDTAIANAELAKSTATDASIIPAGAGHLYYGTPSDAYIASTAPSTQRYFYINAKATSTLTAFEDDGTGHALTTQKVTLSAQLAVQNTKTGAWSWGTAAKTTLKSGVTALDVGGLSTQGLYLVTASASAMPASIVINLACDPKSATCEAARQPGESCGGFGPGINQCDSGLYCDYSADAQVCGGGFNNKGVCDVIPQRCPELIAPVCGCDGHSYKNACLAHEAATSVENASGGCTVPAVVGAWTTPTSDGGAINYTFASDGTFKSTRIPACAMGPIVCHIAYPTQNGTYGVAGTEVDLTYTTALHTPASTVLEYASVYGSDQLTGSDFGFTGLTLVRD